MNCNAVLPVVSYSEKTTARCRRLFHTLANLQLCAVRQFTTIPPGSPAGGISLRHLVALCMGIHCIEVGSLTPPSHTSLSHRSEHIRAISMQSHLDLLQQLLRLWVGGEMVPHRLQDGIDGCRERRLQVTCGKVPVTVMSWCGVG